jgi:hypothetical protein
MRAILLSLLLAGCATTEPSTGAPARYADFYVCPDLPLMRADQTPRQYTLMLIEMYNDCRDNTKK